MYVDLIFIQCGIALRDGVDVDVSVWPCRTHTIHLTYTKYTAYTIMSRVLSKITAENLRQLGNKAYTCKQSVYG